MSSSRERDKSETLSGAAPACDCPSAPNDDCEFDVYVPALAPPGVKSAFGIEAPTSALPAARALVGVAALHVGPSGSAEVEVDFIF